MDANVLNFIELCQWDSARFLILSDNVFAPLIYYSHFFALIPALLLGVFILKNNPKSPLNITFFAIGAFFSFWVFADLVLWATEIPAYTMFFWTALNIAEPLIYICAVLFFYVYAHKKLPDFKWNLVLFLLMLPVILLAPTQFALTGYDLTNCDRAATEGPLATYGYFLEITMALAIGVITLKEIRSADKESRKAILVTALGLIFFLLAFASGNITEVFTENWHIGQIGLIGMPIFLALLTYSIIRFHTFNVKLISAQALVVALWILIISILFIRTIEIVRIIVPLTAMLLLILGIYLVKSVKKEVQQREQIAKMAEDVRRAYAIEKKAKEQLEQLDKVKDQFLMTTQHNLRTPLTSMMGYSDLLLNGTFGKQNEKTVEVIKKFQALSHGMIKMVNDFLDMAQFQLGKSVVNVKPDVELEPILNEIITELQFKADSKGLYLKMEKPEKIFKIQADREKIKAAIFNIVDNAIKYTVKGGVDIVVKNHDTVKITVADTGIGIPKEKQESIFSQMFERGEEAKKVAAIGSGVGLYLSGQIIKSHKGKVWVTSEGEGKGSVFHIELPLSSKG